MKRLAVVLSSALVVVGTAVAPLPTFAQGASKRCANGYPEWANDAFSNRRQANFRCEAAPGGEQQVTAPKSGSPRRPPAARPTTVAAQPAKAEEPATPVSAEAKETPKATTPARLQCRRYLASTGQTVEVPCT